MKSRLIPILIITAGMVFPFTWIANGHKAVQKSYSLMPNSPSLHLNLSESDPILDPALVSDGPSNFISNQLFIGLVRTDEQSGIPLPDLATSWEMSEDATVFTFTLRSSITWTDDNPVTAFDARYGILRSLAPTTSSPWAYLLFGINNAEEYNNGTITDPDLVGIEVLDYTHLRFTLKQPAAYFPSTLILPLARPMPFWVINAHPADWTEPENIVTNGAYRLSDWAHGISMTLQKNLDYYDAENVQIDRVSFSMDDDASAWDSFTERQLDSALVPLEEWEISVSDPILSQQLHSASRLGTYYYGFNIAKEPFDHPLVRKAFAAAVNRQEIIDAIVKYADLPALTFTPPGVWGHIDGESAGIGILFNPAQARQWLAAAGYPNGQGLPPIILMFDTRPQHYEKNLAIANYLRQQWINELGANISIEELEWSAYLEMLETDPPQLWQLRWLADHTDAHGFLRESLDALGRVRFGNWNNPAYEGLIDLAAMTGNLDERAALYLQAEEILVETDAILVPVFYLYNGIATRPYLERSYDNGGYSGWVADWRMSWNLFLPFLTRND